MASLNLSKRDMDLIARVVDTEVPRSIARSNPQQYESMVKAVVDTVVNRVASPDYPNTVEGVLNQDRAFSKINGPSRLDPYGSAANAPKAATSTQAIVDAHLQERAAGAPSTIGGATHYANPNYSDRKNLTGWINPMIEAGAQKFGIGNAVHYHGTPPGQNPAPEVTVSIDGYSPPSTLIAEAAPIPTPAPFERGGILDPAPVPSLVSPAVAAEPKASPLLAPIEATGTVQTNLDRGNEASGLLSDAYYTPQAAPPRASGSATMTQKEPLTATASATANVAPPPVPAVPTPPVPAVPTPPVPAVPTPSMAEQYAMYGAGKVHAPETPAVIPDTYQQPAFSNEPPKVDAYGLPPVPGLQPVPPKPQAPMAAVPQALPPQMRPAAPSPETYFPPAPQAMPPATGMSVWQGNAMSGTATDGSTIFRDNQGQVYRYDPRFDKTVAETPNGLRQWQGMYDPNTQGIEGPLTGGGIKAPSNPLKGLLSEPETQRGAMVRGGLGAAAGGMAGSALLGPLGGLLGAFIGKELAQGRNPLQSGQQMVSNTMTYGPAVAKYRAQNGGFYPQNYYPKAPNAPTGSSQGNNYDQMAAISPRAADLISSGKTGLF